MKSFSLLAGVVASGMLTASGGVGPHEQGILRIPDGQSLLLSVRAEGVQIYTGIPKAGSPATFEWALKGPRATLYDQDNKKVGSHYAGPTWELNDESKVVGVQPPQQRIDAPNTGSIPWLLLEAKSHEGTGLLTRVSYIVRVDTTGGVAPTKPPTKEGQGAQVKYRATYLFLAVDRSEVTSVSHQIGDAETYVMNDGSGIGILASRGSKNSTSPDAASQQGTLLQGYGPWSKAEWATFAAVFAKIEDYRSTEIRRQRAAALYLSKVDTPTLVRSLFYQYSWAFEPDFTEMLFSGRLIELCQMFSGSMRDQDMSLIIFSPKWSTAKYALPWLIESMRKGSFLAARKVQDFGPAAAGQLQALIAMLIDPEYKQDRTDLPEFVPQVVAAIGPAALPDLARVFRNADAWVRGRAAGPLGTILWAADEPTQKGALEILVAIVSDPTVNLSASCYSRTTPAGPGNWDSRKFAPRWLAIQILARFAVSNKRAFEALVSGLRDTDMEISCGSAALLGGLGEAAQPALPALAAALGEPRGEVRNAAAGAFIRLGGIAKSALPAMREQLNSKEWDIRFTAAYTLSHFGQDGAAALPVLVAGLGDPREDVRSNSVAAFMRFGAIAKPSLPAIREMLGAKEPESRKAAAITLSHFGADGAAAWPELVAELSDPKFEVGIAAAVALGRLGNAARSGLPTIRALLEDKSLDVCLVAACALAYFGIDGVASVPILGDRINVAAAQAETDAKGHLSYAQRKGSFRPLEATLEALARLGSLAKDTAPALLHLRAVYKEIGREYDFMYGPRIQQALEAVGG